MGPYYDYSFKFEGTKKRLKKAQNAVRKIQEERKDAGPDHCNFCDPIQFSKDGKSMLWTYYTTDSDDAWVVSNCLKDVALEQGLAFSYYTETTDGTICSSIQTMRIGGDQIDRGSFDAALGMEMAELLLCWRKKPTSIDLAFLSMGLARAVKIGWGEDGYLRLADAGQLRAEIVRVALQHNLFSSPEFHQLLRATKGCFEIIRATLDSEMFAGCQDPYEADYAGFDARVEELELLASVPAGSPTRQSGRMSL